MHSNAEPTPQGTAHHGGTSGHGSTPGHGSHADHADHADHAERYRVRFWRCLVLAAPVVAFSPMFADLVGYRLPDQGWVPWVSPVLGTILYGYGGEPFLTGAVTEVRTRRPGMMLLVASAITVAFVASALTSLDVGHLDLDFWWELALLVVIMLLGHWLEMRALGRASGALEALAVLLPDRAELVTDQGVQAVEVEALRPGDTVLVRPGARIPADGTVVDGTADVDESMITGESRPVPRTVSDRVVAGTVATDSALRIRIEAVGADTALAGIRRMVEQAQSSRSRAQALADSAAALLFWFATGTGVLTFVTWLALGDPGAAVNRTVTVLVIACPHALGLAIPLVIAISTAISARAGILVTDRLALERMRTIDVVLFDKTGTLTRGEPEVVGVVAGDGDEVGLLRSAAAVEADSEHPLARAVLRAAERHGPPPVAADFRALAGRGVRATVDGHELAVGGPNLLRGYELDVPDELRPATDDWAGQGAAVLYVLRNRRVVGAVGLADQVRPESRQAVDDLHARGIRVAMVTGDSRAVAEHVAAELGVDEVFAEVLPADKDARVTELQARGHRVAMVGDGVNDAPALARADVGVAIGAGTDVAIESAGVVLASDDPRGVVSAIALSRRSYRKMRQNLAWAAGYNVVAVPLAAGVLSRYGVVLPPEVGAVLMSASTIVVAVNAQLLRRMSLRPTEATGQATVR